MRHGEGLGKKCIRLFGPSGGADAAGRRREHLVRDLGVEAGLAEALERWFGVCKRFGHLPAGEQDARPGGQHGAGLIALRRVGAAEEVCGGRERGVEVSVPVAVVDVLRVEPGDARCEAVAFTELARVPVAGGRVVETADLPETVGEVVESGRDLGHGPDALAAHDGLLEVLDPARIAGVDAGEPDGAERAHCESLVPGCVGECESLAGELDRLGTLALENLQVARPPGERPGGG